MIVKKSKKKKNWIPCNKISPTSFINLKKIFNVSSDKSPIKFHRYLINYLKVNICFPIVYFVLSVDSSLAIMERFEEENQVNSHLVTDDFPRQLNRMRNKLKYYEEVASNKALGETELANYRAKVNTNIFVGIRLIRKWLVRSVNWVLSSINSMTNVFHPQIPLQII